MAENTTSPEPQKQEVWAIEKAELNALTLTLRQQLLGSVELRLAQLGHGDPKERTMLETIKTWLNSKDHKQAAVLHVMAASILFTVGNMDRIATKRKLVIDPKTGKVGSADGKGASPKGEYTGMYG